MKKKNTILWDSFWDEKSQLPTDFQATGRGSMDIIGFLYTIREVKNILDLKETDVVLDIGCGTGLISLALSPWVKEIHGLDISPKMIERAKKNCSEATNISFGVGKITDLEIPPKTFNKVLAYSVLQYLSNEDEVLKAFQSLAMVLPENGVALYAANPDIDKKEKYVEVVISSSGTPEEKENNLHIINSVLWISPERIVDLALQAGLILKVIPISKRIWQCFFMYNLMVYHG